MEPTALALETAGESAWQQLQQPWPWPMAAPLGWAGWPERMPQSAQVLRSALARRMYFPASESEMPLAWRLAIRRAYLLPATAPNPNRQIGQERLK
jgi:hypothetical protein